MGSSTYSNDDYAARASVRAKTGVTFAHHDAVRTGNAHGLHPSLNPMGMKIREARDSDQHPVSVPIALCNDLTGSMLSVPITLQAEEPKLMGLFLKDKADGKTYLGDGYPAILIAGVDDYYAVGPETCLQVGQFESGLEIDDNLTNLLLTGMGGGNSGESYDLFLYTLARHTAHDHWDKRQKKGHAFIIGDEPLFNKVTAQEVKEVLGEDIGEDIPIQNVIREVKKRYWLFYVLPAMTSHYGNPHVVSGWKDRIGEENVLLLPEPTKICELLVSTVAMCEGSATLDDLAAASIANSAVCKALAPLAKAGISKHSADSLPPIKRAGASPSRL